MKRFTLLAFVFSAMLLNTSCSDDDNNSNNDDPGNTPGQGTDLEITKSGILNEDQTWTADHIYVLDGKVVVNEGHTLTIKPGTIIKGKGGEGSAASALVIDQGAKIEANGTAEKPIIFTSVADNIEIGQTAGSNLTVNDNSLWGGVIVLGKAPISVTGDNTTFQIEGIPADEPYGQYGGNDPHDNSGSMQYVSIRHGGITIGADNEINGLSLGGVGDGTTISNIEIVANQDDGIEHFGGTVNESNILIWGQGDDGLDIDQSYQGTIDNALVIMKSDAGSGLEIDGPEGSSATEAAFTLKNITLIGADFGSYYADLRDGALGSLNNVLAYGFASESTVNIADEDTQAEFDNGKITFSNWEVVLPAGQTIDNLISGDFLGNTSAFTSNVSVVASKDAATVGADTSVFGWTYAAQNNAF